MKAATIRQLVYWLYEVTSSNAQDAHGHLLACLFLGFVIYDVICRSAGRFFTDEQQQYLAAYAEISLRCYNALAAEAVSLAKRLWKYVPKFHLWTHMSYDQAKDCLLYTSPSPRDS